MLGTPFSSVPPSLVLPSPLSPFLSCHVSFLCPVLRCWGGNSVCLSHSQRERLVGAHHSFFLRDVTELQQ